MSLAREAEQRRKEKEERERLKRSQSPTAIQLYETSTPEQHKGAMVRAGIHVYDGGLSNFRSGSFCECTLKIYQSEETLRLPMQTCTKVVDVRNFVATRCMVTPETIDLIAKRGCTWLKLKDHEQMMTNVTVKGVRSFAPEKHRYAHPAVMLGAGYNGIKMALLYKKEKRSDFVMFERYDRVGGHAWLKAANKTSKLQTDLAAFHVWFGPMWDESNELLGPPTDWSTWPKKDEVIAHMQHACERYDIIPHITFQTDISKLDIVGKRTDHDRHYHLVGQHLAGQHEVFSVDAGVVYHYPGAYYRPRVIIYPGEEGFEGKIGYGMMDGIPYDNLAHKRTAILGNGAFAVENIRTCCEYAAEKIYLITRRRNLPCPRLCCWYVHQGIHPTPATMLLNMFTPMFEQCGFDDPWEYHSVYASKDRKNCQIASASRFGIGDVTFLAVATGRCEYVVDTVKRISASTLVLNGGGKIDDVHNIIKALGLVTDENVDKMHAIKECVGLWPNSDCRRYVFVDPLGMNAANFSSMSAGSGSLFTSIMAKHFIDHPMEWSRFEGLGALSLLPKSTATEFRAAHQWDAKYVTQTSVVVQSVCPLVIGTAGDVDGYFHKVVWACDPLEKCFAECVASWDQYQMEWKAQGFDFIYVPYPYTMAHIDEWNAHYEANVGPLTLADREEWLRRHRPEELAAAKGDKLHIAEDMKWWRETDKDAAHGFWWGKSSASPDGGG